MLFALQQCDRLVVDCTGQCVQNKLSFYVTDRNKIHSVTRFPFSVIQNVCDGHPKTRYLVAVDDSQNSLEEIVRVSDLQGAGNFFGTRGSRV